MVGKNKSDMLGGGGQHRDGLHGGVATCDTDAPDEGAAVPGPAQGVWETCDTRTCHQQAVAPGSKEEPNNRVASHATRTSHRRAREKRAEASEWTSQQRQL